MKKVLVIESCPGTPHTDTSLEILIREKELGSSVFFGLIFPKNISWEYAMQYPQSSLEPLSGFIQQNIRQICEKFNIPVLYPDNDEQYISEKLWVDLILNEHKFLGKWDFKKIITSTISGLINRTEPDLQSTELKEISKKFANVALNTYYSTLNLITKINPDLIYYYNGRWASCKPVEWAAKDSNVEVLHHERGADIDKFMLYSEPYYDFQSIKRRIKENTAAINPEILRFVGSSHYLNKRNGSETYWPSFTNKQIKGILPEPLKGKKFVCYFSSSEDEFSQIPGNQIETYFGKQFEAFAKLKKICEKNGMLLVVRVHPHVANKHRSELEFWQSQKSDTTIIFNANDSIDTYTLIDNCTSAVSFATTVGLEAAFSNKPSILIGNSPWYGESSFNCPRNEIELFNMLINPIKPNDSNFVYSYGYYMENFGHKFKYFKPTNFWSGKFMGSLIQPSAVGL